MEKLRWAVGLLWLIVGMKKIVKSRLKRVKSVLRPKVQLFAQSVDFVEYLRTDCLVGVFALPQFAQTRLNVLKLFHDELSPTALRARLVASEVTVSAAEAARVQQHFAHRSGLQPRSLQAQNGAVSDRPAFGPHPLRFAAVHWFYAAQKLLEFREGALRMGLSEHIFVVFDFVGPQIPQRCQLRRTMLRVRKGSVEIGALRGSIGLPIGVWVEADGCERGALYEVEGFHQ